MSDADKRLGVTRVRRVEGDQTILGSMEDQYDLIVVWLVDPEGFEASYLRPLQHEEYLDVVEMERAGWVREDA